MMDEMGEGAAQKFHAARDAYKQARLAQRKVIVEALRCALGSVTMQRRWRGRQCSKLSACRAAIRR